MLLLLPWLVRARRLGFREGAAGAAHARRLAGGRLVGAHLARVAQVHAAMRLVVARRARHALTQLGRLEPRLAAAAQVARHRQQRRRADDIHRLPLTSLGAVELEGKIVPRVKVRVRVRVSLRARVRVRLG